MLLKDATVTQLLEEFERRTDGCIFAGLLKNENAGTLGTDAVYGANGNPYLCRVLWEELKDRLASLSEPAVSSD